MNKILCVLTILFVISVAPVFAQTNPITVKTDDNSYDEGNTIVVSGQVTVAIPGTPVVLQIFHKGNMIDVAQITVAQDGSYTHTIIAEGPLWKKEGDYLIRASFGEGNIAETEFEFTPKTGAPEATQIFEVDAGSSGTFDVKYTIKGGIVNNMVIDSRNFALVIQIDSPDDGAITLELPRKFIGAEKQDGKDDIFITLVDAIEVPYKETVVGSDSRTITINFEENDTKIEIIGTYVIPEFNTITLILLAGIITTVLLTRNRFQISIN